MLRKQKPKDRRGKITLVNASAEFKKGQPKNFIPPDGIRKIADAFNAGKDVDTFIKVITTEEAAKNDFNLSPSRYLAVGEVQTNRPIKDILAEIKVLEAERELLDTELTPILARIAKMEANIRE